MKSKRSQVKSAIPPTENDSFTASSGDEVDIDASATESDDTDDMDENGSVASNSDEVGNDTVASEVEGGSDSEASEDIAAYEDKEDADSSVDNDNNNDEDTLEKQAESRNELIQKSVFQRYVERQGKQLYIRFPRSVGEAEFEQKAKELSPLIIKVHKPRQKYARFCLVDFESKSDRDITLNMLKKQMRKGELEKFLVEIPRTEDATYVQKIADMKIKSIENKRLKARVKKASRKAAKSENFTSTVLVFNIPETATMAQIRELFPNAVDVQLKANKGKGGKTLTDKTMAAVTFSSSMEARAGTKKKIVLNGNVLSIKFDSQSWRKKKIGKKQHKLKVKTINDPSNGKIEKSTESLKNKNNNNKRKIQDAEDTVPSPKKLAIARGSENRGKFKKTKSKPVAKEF